MAFAKQKVYEVVYLKKLASENPDYNTLQILKKIKKPLKTVKHLLNP
jgi:5-methyltetrahydropteroyltriglutamate--homocysteine methyltransferase